MLDRGANRAREPGRALLLRELRMEAIELAQLAVGIPAQIAAAGVPQIELRDLLEAAPRIEARGQFIGQSFVLNEALLARGADGLLVESLGFQLAAFEAGDLGADQRRAGLEILGAVLRPGEKPLVM